MSPRKALYKIVFPIVGLVFAIATSEAQTSSKSPVPVWANEPRIQKESRMKWWKEARFGMFIHWGLYSSAARHEWVQSREKMNGKSYRKYFEIFNPDLYDPQDWARKAKQAGMKYVVITTKHHEGFCLWNSRYTNFKAPNTTAGKDLLKPLVDAFRAEGIRIGFYYSLID